MSARKPDAWLYSICGDHRFAETREEAEQENLDKEPEERWLKPLYALTDADLEAIRRAAEIVECAGHEQSDLIALAAALRSITDERKGT